MSSFWILETSTERGLIALVKKGEVIFAKELPFGYNQSKFLMPELQKAMHAYPHTELNAISVGIGPGSYTGIRIGVAVAKALAYAWQLPLIGFCTLEAFVPQEAASFAAILDAKMGGAYLLKGIKDQQAKVSYSSPPSVMPLADLKGQLEDTQLLVTPYQTNLKAKIDQIYPQAPWQWCEQAPSAWHLAQVVQAKYEQRDWSEPLKLLYLRKTEAEEKS